ncbi:hypothetical protein PtA15_18A392 [Puccinia triticina]|uniref:Uncharacterized protein n=1 Tax=Puccinia triticina TaxID=208348 RepID=A0ABY7DAH9_9BASI|nr:uncharacterized protein PtA15_18A392 [Puccinia triticina]WAQ93332.1 hypothetical protein PtA15_18A392 [Puccinia triticina]WAR63330.1 hypothetical protein PtB15_18B413 [Puccinia triticina]
MHSQKATCPLTAEVIARPTRAPPSTSPSSPLPIRSPAHLVPLSTLHSHTPIFGPRPHPRAAPSLAVPSTLAPSPPLPLPPAQAPCSSCPPPPAPPTPPPTRSPPRPPPPEVECPCEPTSSPTPLKHLWTVPQQPHKKKSSLITNFGFAKRFEDHTNGLWPPHVMMLLALLLHTQTARPGTF